MNRGGLGLQTGPSYSVITGSPAPPGDGSWDVALGGESAMIEAPREWDWGCGRDILLPIM